MIEKNPKPSKTCTLPKAEALQNKLCSISGSYRSGPGYSSSHLAEALRLCLQTPLALRQKPGSAGRQRTVAREIWRFLPCR